MCCSCATLTSDLVLLKLARFKHGSGTCPVVGYIVQRLTRSAVAGTCNIGYLTPTELTNCLKQPYVGDGSACIDIGEMKLNHSLYTCILMSFNARIYTTLWSAIT